MKALLKLGKEREPEVNFVLAALPSTAARVMAAGNTLARVLKRQRYGPHDNAIYAIDEISQVPMAMLAVIARGVHLGARYAMLGDFEGQFLPIADGWSSSRPVRDTELVKDLAGCLHVRLTTNWRCRDDPAHFEHYVGLYPYADASPDVVRAKVREVQRHYRWNKQRQVDIYLVISHRKRRAVNRKLNLERDAMDGVYIPSVGGVKGLSSQPQAMWLRPGMSVLGCSGTRKKVINGCEYIVAAVTADTVTVDMHADYHTGNDKMEWGVVLTPGGVQVAAAGLRPVLLPHAGPHPPGRRGDALGHGAPPLRHAAPARRVEPRAQKRRPDHPDSDAGARVRGQATRRAR